jgi:hypothetical protein
VKDRGGSEGGWCEVYGREDADRFTNESERFGKGIGGSCGAIGDIAEVICGISESVLAVRGLPGYRLNFMLLCFLT